MRADRGFTPLEKSTDFRERSSLTGFTTIEIIMAIVIIGILAAVVMPAFVNSFNALKAESAYRQLMQDIRYVRQVAAVRRLPHGISFNPAAESYFAWRQAAANIIKDPATQKSLSVTYSGGKFSGIDLAGTTFTVPSLNVLEFDSLGAPASGGTVTISYQGISKTISVEANTGRVY